MDDLIKKGQAIFRLCLCSALTVSYGGVTIMQVDGQVFAHHLFKPLPALSLWLRNVGLRI